MNSGRTNTRLIAGMLAAAVVVVLIFALIVPERSGVGPGGVVLTERERVERVERERIALQQAAATGGQAEAGAGSSKAGASEEGASADGGTSSSISLTTGTLTGGGGLGTLGDLLNTSGTLTQAERDALAAAKAAADAAAAAEAAEAEADAAADGGPKSPAQISGRVTSTSGGPVEGAEVQLLGAATALTDAEGMYSLLATKAGTAIMQALPPPGSDYAPGRSRTFNVVLGRQYTDINFELGEGLALRGIVVDSEGRPLAGARITAFVDNTAVGASTDESGRFEITNVSADGMVQQLAVTLDGYDPEFRQALSVLDGEQRFVLRKQLTVDLRVVWELDGSPVTLYKYRILKRGPNGLDWATSPLADRVNSEDGTAVIKNIAEGEYRVEVTVLNSRGIETGVRGSDRFVITRDSEAQGVDVKIGLGQTLTGRVVMAGTSTGVAGASVRMIPPTVRPGSYYLPDMDFQPEPAMTAADGSFSFTGMPPGLYSFRAEKGTLQTVLPIDVNITVDVEPQPITIELSQGGVIFGTIIGEDGTAPTDAQVKVGVQRPNADGWDPRQVMVETDGSFRTEGLPMGTHQFSAMVNGREVENRNVDLAAGEEEEIIVDLSGAVTVTGTVSVNGGDAGGQVSHVQFFGTDGSQSPRVGVLPDGTYTAKLQPGNYVVGARSNAFNEGQLEGTISVAAGEEQEINLDVPVADADLVLVFPEGQFQRGEVVISPRDRGSRYAFIKRELDQPNRHMPGMIGGEYQATFTSKDGAWHGESEWVRVGEGSENTFTLDVVKKVNAQRVGGWSPGELPNTTSRALSFDVSNVVQSAGAISVLVDYERGRHPVEPSAVILYENGAPVAEDRHVGWSGQEKWNHRYNLVLNSRPGGASYRLEVHLRADGGSDSTGSIYLSMN